MAEGMDYDDCMLKLPEELLEAIESGTMTDEQLRLLITLEAKAIGLSYEEAYALAKARSLPSNGIGIDLQLLFGLVLA